MYVSRQLQSLASNRQVYRTLTSKFSVLESDRLRRSWLVWCRHIRVVPEAFVQRLGVHLQIGPSHEKRNVDSPFSVLWGIVPVSLQLGGLHGLSVAAGGDEGVVGIDQSVALGLFK